MKIVVTGSAGLLGHHVAESCVKAGHEVVGVDVAPQRGEGWTQITADVTDLGTAVQIFHGADAVLHCAAVPRPVGNAPSHVWQVNMAAIYAATEGTRLAEVPLFIYASSFSVYGYPFARKLPVPHFLPLDETHPVAPQDVYGTTKWLGEELIEAMVRQGAFRAVSLRMPWIQTPDSFHAEIGPRRDSAGAAADLWAYLDARDAGAGFAAALNWMGDGHLRCLLSADDSYSLQPTRELIAASFGDAPKLRAPLSGTAGLIDIGLAERELGWSPQHHWREYPAKEGA